jgi:hypothetical protein
MAKRATGFPLPVSPLHAQLVPWGKGLTMHRVHKNQYLPNVFNPSVKGNARFSPIRDAKKDIIPTLYAATTSRGAMMETVFHDVPYKKGLKTVSKHHLAGEVHSTLLFHIDFNLIDLSKVALKKIGVKPEHLISTTKAHYRGTRAWAEAFYAEYSTAQGLLWTSRQDDRCNAVVLFGPRIKPSDFSITGTSTTLMTAGVVWDPVNQLATDMDVILV